MKRASPANRRTRFKSFRAKRLATRHGAYEAYAEFLTETLAFILHGTARQAL